MNYMLHGEWRTFKMTYAPTQTGIIVYPQEQDGTIYLRITNPGGIIEPGSNHNGRPVVGRAIEETDPTKPYNVYIFIDQYEPTYILHYQGYLLDPWLGEQPKMVIVGRYLIERFNPEKTAEPADANTEVALAEGQDEGTWILIKP